MRQRKKWAAVPGLCLCLLFVLSGCGRTSLDDLFSLPQHSAASTEISALVEAAIAEGCEYAAPNTGSYRQSLQLYDIDGDGRSEAFAFLRNGEGVPLVHIYRDSGSGYALTASILGDGNAIGSIEYADLNGCGMAELILTWQISADIRVLKVYSLRGWNPAVLFSVDSTAFFAYDLDTDEMPELLNIRFESYGDSYVDVYQLDRDNEYAVDSVRLSAPLESLGRARTGLIQAGIPALIIEGEYDGGLMSEVLVWQDEGVVSLGDKGENWRSYPVYAADIDGDGYLELPDAVPLYSQSESGAQYWLFDWYKLDAAGRRTWLCATYHCYSDGWYLLIPEELRETLTVRREDSVSGERIVVLSQTDPHDGSVTDFLRLYTLTGENRYDRVALADRFSLRSEDTTIYAARLISSLMTEEQVRDGFHLIYTEWVSEAS